ncbi:MAG: DNA-binding protein HU-beta, partial [uncultured Sphingomonas sp.]
EQAGTHHPGGGPRGAEPHGRGARGGDHAGGDHLDVEARRRGAAGGFRQLLRHSPQGLGRPQPAYRRAAADCVQRQSEVPAGQGAEGRRSV